MMTTTFNHQHQQWKHFSLTHITYPTINNATLIESITPPLLALLSLTPPFGVCALVTSVFFQKDVVAAYLLVGSLLTAAISSAIKRVLKHPRPPRYDDDGDVEYGMPSNHSCFAWFGATFVILYIVRRGGVWASSSLSSYSLRGSNDGSTPPSAAAISQSSSAWKLFSKVWHHLHTSIAIVLFIGIALGCAYSRVYLGYHTANQVTAGSILGCALGVLWYRMFELRLVRDSLVWLDGGMHELERTRQRLHYHGSGGGEWKEE